MKITRQRLTEILKEEMQNVIDEGFKDYFPELTFGKKPWPPRAPEKSHMWKDPETGLSRWVTKDEHAELSASAEGDS